MVKSVFQPIHGKMGTRGGFGSYSPTESLFTFFGTYPLGRMDLLLTSFVPNHPNIIKKKKKMFIFACRIQSATVNSFSLYAEDCD